MKRFLLHFVSIVLYFPVVCLVFLYLVLKPDKMVTFYLGLEATLDVLDKGVKKVN